MLRANRGVLLLANLMAVGLVSLLVTTYFSVLQHEVASVNRMTGRAQALYLAEAGLDAANDLLSQDWGSYRRASSFPMRESLLVVLDRQPVTVGEFDVRVSAIDAQTLRLTSTGRSLPRPSGGVAQGLPRYAIERTLTMVVVRKEKPVFHRRGPSGILELAVSYFDKDGIPDLVVMTGNLVATHGGHADGTLSSGSQDALRIGLHLLASFRDVDGDGDLDLILSDAPSRTSTHYRALISTIELTKEHEAAKLFNVTAANVCDAKHAIPVVAKGWVWFQEAPLAEFEPGTEVFLNKPTYNGTLIVSWGEIQPSSSAHIGLATP